MLKMTANRNLTFSKTPIYNYPRGKEGQCASPCKFPDDQSNRLYVTALYIKMAANCHLEL